MGYLNNNVITVDAILTKKGRELLARGDGSFKITQFALADDEIDYTLYNPSHPSGSAFYGEAIENMPLLEAFPDETQDLKYKLATLPRGTAKMPILSLQGYPSVSVPQGASVIITPETLNYLGQTSFVETSGYTFTISDVRLMNQFKGVGIDTISVNALNQTQTVGTNVSKTVVGLTVNMRATTVNTLYGSSLTQLTATLQVVGRDSGARVTVPISVTKIN